MSPDLRPAADDNSLIGCTSHELTADWPLASTHFVDSQYAFRCSFGCVLFIEPDFFDNNAPFDNTNPIYLINLLWKLGLGIYVRLRESCTILAFFTEYKENEHLFFCEFHKR